MIIRDTSPGHNRATSGSRGLLSHLDASRPHKPHMEMFPTARRSACDRCREQKLRCPRRRDPTQPCERCTRAGRRCVTGFTKPLGRGVRTTTRANRTLAGETKPTKVARTASDGSHSELQGFQCPALSAFSPLSPAQTATTSPNTSLNLLPSSDWTFSAMARRPDDLATVVGRGPQSGRAIHAAWLDRSAVSLPGQDEIPSLNSIDDVDFWVQNIPTTMNLGDLTATRPFNTANSHDSVDPPLSSRANASFDYLNTPSVSANGNEPETLEHKKAFECCDRQLSRLGLELCNQIEKQEKLHPHCFRNDVRAVRPMDQVHEVIGNALSSSEKFIAILQAHPRNQRPNGSHDTLMPQDSDNMTLQLTCSLNAITTYLRLITLFDKLFQAIHGIALSNSSKPPSRGLHEPQLLPGLQLAGFSVCQSGLQAKILVQAVQHQFETMESVLGVPSELRLSDRQGSYADGILADGLGTQFFESLLGARLGMSMRCEYGGSVTTAQQRFAPLASLRRSIDKVVQLTSIV